MYPCRQGFDNAGKITDVEISAQLRQFIRFYGLYRFANNQGPSVLKTKTEQQQNSCINLTMKILLFQVSQSCSFHVLG